MKRLPRLLSSLVLLLAACGGGGGSIDASSGGPACSNCTLSLFVGNLVSPVGGGADGAGSAARFYGPSGVATDAAGNVYVADRANNAIRKITPTGVVSTFAGRAGGQLWAGYIEGIGDTARFSSPAAVATDRAGNVYVADAGSSVIRKITPAGLVSTLAGTAAGTGGMSALQVPYCDTVDVTNVATTGCTGVTFDNPNGVATDSVGNVYVADMNNNVIRKILPNGTTSTLAGTPFIPGSPPTYNDSTGTGPAGATFFMPSQIAADSAGNLYVSDLSGFIRKILPDGTVSTLAVPGGPLVTDSAGIFYVADVANNVINKTLPDLSSSVLAGSGMVGSADGLGAAASFNYPVGVATDSAGNVYVADSGNNTIRKILPDGTVSTFAGQAAVVGSADGTGAAASFNTTNGVATDSAGNVYVADQYNNTIRKITPTGDVTTLAGLVGGGYGGVSGIYCDTVDVESELANPDSTGCAGVTFNGPTGVVTDSAGNVYVSDTGDAVIRQITPAGVVSTLAGTFGGGVGAVSQFYCDTADVTNELANPGTTGCTGVTFNGPAGIATDSVGNVYVADSLDHVIRKIAPGGVVSTLAGNGAVDLYAASPPLPCFGVATTCGDGTGSAAYFSSPFGIATDRDGNVYVADNYASNIRKITPAGVVSTIAGKLGSAGWADGMGTNARFNTPTSVATDSVGNVYVADGANYTIRKIAPSGVVSTLVGIGVVGTVVNSSAPSGLFVSGPLPGRLEFTNGIAVFGSSLYITMLNGVAVVSKLP